MKLVLIFHLQIISFYSILLLHMLTNAKMLHYFMVEYNWIVVMLLIAIVGIIIKIIVTKFFERRRRHQSLLNLL